MKNLLIIDYPFHYTDIKIKYMDKEILRNKYKETRKNVKDKENSDNIIDSLFAGENLHSEETEEKIANEHSVDPDDYALYKKYLS